MPAERDQSDCVWSRKKGAGGYRNNNVVGEKIPALDRVAEGFTKEELAQKIREGVTPVAADPTKPPPMLNMPAWGELLSDDEITSLVEYLFSLLPEGAGTDEW